MVSTQQINERSALTIVGEYILLQQYSPESGLVVIQIHANNVNDLIDRIKAALRGDE